MLDDDLALRLLQIPRERLRGITETLARLADPTDLERGELTLEGLQESLKDPLTYANLVRIYDPSIMRLMAQRDAGSLSMDGYAEAVDAYCESLSAPTH